MGEWTTYPLSQFVDPVRSICYGIVQPGSRHDDGIPIVRVNNFRDGQIDTRDALEVSPSIEEKYRRSRLHGGELLVTLVGTMGLSAIVPEALRGWNVARAVGVVPLRDDVDKRWINFVIRSAPSQEFIGIHANTTVQATFNLKDLAQLPVPMPPEEIRAAASELLSALDDKIELNRRTNETLEALARAIFKDWFVDFGPTRAKAEGGEPYLAPELWDLFPDALDDDDKPEGWGMRSVYDFANVVYGAPFSSKQFNTEKLGLPLIRIRDLATHEPGVCTEEKHSKGHIIEPGDIVVGMDGEFRLHVWKGPKSWLNQRVCHFEPLSGVPTSFLVESLKEPLAYFERGKVGTTVIHLGKSDIDTFQLIHPGEKGLLSFADLVEPLVDRSVKNSLESRSLAQTRDLLLPKLMSGEIRLREAERTVEAVA